MFRNVLVPGDLTDRTIRALDAATDVAPPGGARITLLHVIETIPGAEFEELSSFYRKLDRQASDRLKEIVAGISNKRGDITIEIVYGRRVAEVLRFVREHDIDLIVLASHPVDPSEPYGGLGTMSYKLGILAPCAVLLVK